MNTKVVTRIAPSPTSNFCHIGNVRTLLYNYFLAKQSGGKFYVRLEDTDRGRYNSDFLNYFKNMCDWLGIVPDASYWNPDKSIGSFIQSERDYSDKINFLIEKGYAYYAFDTKDDLDKAHSTISNFKYDAFTRHNMINSFTLSADDVKNRISNGDSYVVRFAVPSNIDITFNDAILGDITINSNQLDDKVLLKSNGIASYHLANTADDHDMGVTHVLRGQEWISSTPLHILIYNAFGWDIPTFAHLPLIMNPDGKGKLSKRTASKYGIPIAPIGYIDFDGKSVDGWKEKGFDSDVFINNLSLIGWSPNDSNEIMSMNDLISKFSLDRVHKHGARFDMDKAKHFNSWYINNIRSNDYLLNHVDFKGCQYSYDDKINIINLAKKRSVFCTDLQDIVDIFVDPVNINVDKVNDNFISVFSKFVDVVTVDSFDWTSDSIKQTIYDICKSMNIKMGKIMPDLRMAITGGLPGPDLVTVMSILSKETTLQRINNYLKVLV